MANQQSKNIQYSGLTTLPDDYQSVDGSLAFATNAVYEDNAVKIIPPALAKNLIVEKGDKVYVHSMATYTHYIVVHESDEGVTLYWVDEADCGESDNKVICVRNEEGSVEDTRVHEIGTYAGTFVDLAFVGNTVILSTSESLQYFIWEADNSDYSYLGDSIPKIDIQLSLGLNTIGKTYTDTGITLADVATTTASSDYTFVTSGTFNQEKEDSGSHAWKFTDADLELEAGKSYRLRYAYPKAATSVTKLRLYGINRAGARVEIVNFSSTSLGTFHVDDTIGGLYFTIHLRDNSTVTYSSNTVILECSGDSVSVSIRQIENTMENHTAVMGYMNKFVNEYGTTKNRFIYPFFVRYAVRLYDSTHSQISVPILLFPNTGYVPYLRPFPQSTKTALDMYAFCADLQYKILSEIDKSWTDLIIGVDVYVSQPVYCYKQGQGFEEDEQSVQYKCWHYDSSKQEVDADDIAELDYGLGQLKDTTNRSDNYDVYNLSEILVSDYGFLNPSDSSTWYLAQIAPKEDEEIEKDIVETCNFYKVKTIMFSDMLISDDFVDIDMEKDTLSALEARESLSEDIVNYDGFSSVNLNVYNNRLNMYGGKALLPSITPMELQNGKTMNTYDYESCYVRIKTDEGTRVVECKKEGFLNTRLPWFFYPDIRAYEYIEKVGEGYYVLPLTQHEFLNGAYIYQGITYLLDYINGNISFEEGWEELDISENREVSITNKIYVSEASNPFVFKNEMVCTAGSGQVLALSSAAKALSQGQFGQFPLYAFTDEGIWAMSVGSTGAYETVQPIARDVVPTDAVKAITQLDSSVVFVTNRGVMLVEGSNVVCMSDDIDGDFGQFDPRTLDGFYGIMKKYLDFSTDDTDKTIGKWAEQAFFDFIRSCQMKYDYVHQRITMYSDDCDIAYVYSLKSKQWLMQLTALQDNVNSYPDAYALRNLSEQVGGVDCTELVNLSEYDLETARLPMVFITRPFKLDAPDTFKTVSDIIQRGYFRQDEKIKHIIGTVLYGSPDLFNWFAVKSNVGSKVQNLHGSPYKYFRVLVVSRLDAKEGISGCSVWYEPKDTQRLR